VLALDGYRLGDYPVILYLSTLLIVELSRELERINPMLKDRELSFLFWNRLTKRINGDII